MSQQRMQVIKLIDWPQNTIKSWRNVTSILQKIAKCISLMLCGLLLPWQILRWELSFSFWNCCSNSLLVCSQFLTALTGSWFSCSLQQHLSFSQHLMCRTPLSISLLMLLKMTAVSLTVIFIKFVVIIWHMQYFIQHSWFILPLHPPDAVILFLISEWSVQSEAAACSHTSTALSPAVTSTGAPNLLKVTDGISQRQEEKFKFFTLPSGSSF